MQLKDTDDTEQFELALKILDLFKKGIPYDKISKMLEIGDTAETSRNRLRRAKIKFGEKLLKHFEERGIEVSSVHTVWDKTKEYSVCTRHESNKVSSEDLIEAFKRGINFKDRTLPINRDFSKAKHNLLIVDPADVHIGKLCESSRHKYNSQIALQRAREGIEGIMGMASGFDYGQILLVIGNDILHTEDGRHTTGGTPQDTDGSWFTNYNAALELYISTIRWLKEFAPVHVKHNRSNHDSIGGYCLAVTLMKMFESDPDITFDVSKDYRVYYKWGTNLIGFGHLDHVKDAEVPMLMANEASKLWSDTVHRTFYGHHLHQKKATSWKSGQDYKGMELRKLRSPSDADDWHEKMGFVGGKLAVEGFVHHPTAGKIAELTHPF